MAATGTTPAPLDSSRRPLKTQPAVPREPMVAGMAGALAWLHSTLEAELHARIFCANRLGNLNCYLAEDAGRSCIRMGHLGQPKIYPNLNPSAAIPVDREQVFSLRSFADNYRMNRGKEHGHYVPNSRFIFVTTMTGQTLMHQRYRHPALSEGKPVLYAGEAYFNNGRLEWWSNGSGNYRPDPDHAAQAGLPMDQFYPYDEILKGAHTRVDAHRLRPVIAGGQARGGNQVQAKFPSRYFDGFPSGRR